MMVPVHERVATLDALGQEEVDGCSLMIDTTAAVLGQEEEDDV